MKSKTLKEIAEETYLAILDPMSDDTGETKIMEACLEYAKSIVPEEENHQRSMYGDYDYGFNTCREQILSHLSKEEELLNQSSYDKHN